MDKTPSSALPHYTTMSARAPATLSAQCRAELDAHTHAAWRSRDGWTFRVYGLGLPDGRMSYIVRQLEQDEASTEPLPPDQLLAEYVGGVGQVRKPSAALSEAEGRALLKLLDAVIRP